MSGKQGIDLNTCVLHRALCHRYRIFVQTPYQYLEETCKKTLALSNNPDIIQIINYKFIVQYYVVL